MSTTKRSKKDSTSTSEPNGNGYTNGHTNGLNGHSNGNGHVDDFAEKKLAAEQYYLDTCERYKVIPDAAIVVSSNFIKFHPNLQDLAWNLSGKGPKRAVDVL